MTRYVLGFMFNANLDQVLLLRKARPRWQVGRLNGVGGRIEGGERAFDAMVREFREETGIVTVDQNWLMFAEMRRDGQFEVECFATVGQVCEARTVTDETLSILCVRDCHALRIDLVDNVPWLIALAIDCLSSRGPSATFATYASIAQRGG